MDITITDSLALTEDLKLSDDSKLAKAGTKELRSDTTSFIKQFGDSVDKAPFKSISLGIKITAPSEVIDKVATLAVNASASAQLSIRTAKDKVVFDDGDSFSPPIPITANDCWVAFELDTNLTGKLSGKADGFGASLTLSSAVAFATYCVQHPAGGAFPSLKDAITTTLNAFSVTSSAKALRDQAPGTINVNHLTGSVKIAGSYQFPLSIDALASAQLPFNYGVKVQPELTLKVAGEVGITGDLLIRCYKVTPTQLCLACYRTKGSTLSVSFTAAAGIQANLGTTDLLPAFFRAVFPDADLKKAGITAEDAKALDAVLKDCVDRSLSLSLNAECSAADSHEAAIFCTVDLATGDAKKTDDALAAALSGDWTQLVALPNVHVSRNVLQTVDKRETKIKVNLLGIYNAETVDSFVKTCTIIHDDTGAVTITDKITASHLAAASTPFAADPDKLRMALSQAFLATVTYTAGRAGLPAVSTVISVTQSYFRYKASMDRQAMKDELLLGPELGLYAKGTWDKVLAANKSFTQAMIDVTANFGMDAIQSLFFADPKSRKCRLPYDLKQVGRRVMVDLIDPDDPSAGARLAVLTNDTIWAALDDLGDMAQDQLKTIPYLQHYSDPEIGAIASDWQDVTWWANAMANAGPALANLLKAAGQAKGDPTKDPQFMSAQEKLGRVLGDVAKNARANFAGGWGVAVMDMLSGNAPAIGMTVTAHQIGTTKYSRVAPTPQSATTLTAVAGQK